MKKDRPGRESAPQPIQIGRIGLAVTWLARSRQNLFGELLELPIDRCLGRWREVSRQAKEELLECRPLPDDSTSRLDANRTVDDLEVVIRTPLFRMGLPNIEPNRIGIEIQNIDFTNEFIGGGRIISVPIPPIPRYSASTHHSKHRRYPRDAKLAKRTIAAASRQTNRIRINQKVHYNSVEREDMPLNALHSIPCNGARVSAHCLHGKRASTGRLGIEATVNSNEDVDKLQLEAYRRMTGEERLRIGLGLYEASLAIAREGIRNRFPETDDAEVEEKLRSRIRAGYEIESKWQKRSDRDRGGAAG